MPAADYRIRRLGRLNDLDIWLVDGERIRNEIDIDFTCGGHHLVYPWYVPATDVFIDDALGPLDRTATLLHELVEHSLMDGRGWGYDRAHDAASTAEAPFRARLARRRQTAIDLTAVRRAFDAWLLDHVGRPRNAGRAR